MIESLAITNDNKYIVFGDRNNILHFWDWENKTLIKKFNDHTA